ncbi:MAG TPA: hypothetical protein VF883_09785 [Thermoanaerobaculia bacterium]
MRHLVEHALHVLRARADAAQKVLPLFIQLVQVIAQQQVTETVDGEDRRLQIV